MKLRDCAWCHKGIIFKHGIVKRGRYFVICGRCYRQYLREISVKNHNRRIKYRGLADV